MLYTFVPRKVWGASPATETFITNRVKDPAVGKDTIIIHHTGAVDTHDTTPNRWDYDRAVAYMHRLQWVRPDLGPLPYSYNLAASEDLSTVWVFEGRGSSARGAHTADYNKRGIGLGIFGNFDREDVDAALRLIEAGEQLCRDLRDGHIGLPLINLGMNLSPRGWEVWGHRDGPGVKKTCPGNTLYPKLAAFSLTLPTPKPDPEPEEEMRLAEQFARGLTKDRIVEMVDADLIGPPTMSRQDRIDYWTNLLPHPELPAWEMFYTNLQVRNAVNLQRFA